MREVLWIDDECMNSSGELSDLGISVVNTAYDNGIKITSMLTYKEGINAIRNHPLKWCAVILDIRNDKATTEKASDYELLFEDILKIQSVSKLYTCQEQYKDVLTIANDFCGEGTWQRLLNALYKITINDIKNNPALFNEMRKILEDIMKVLEQYRYSYFAETKEEISLNNLSRYIGNDKNVPVYIQRAFHTLTSVTQNGSHRLEVDSDVSCSRAPYLLRSCLYELCNILIWMRNLA